MGISTAISTAISPAFLFLVMNYYHTTFGTNTAENLQTGSYTNQAVLMNSAIPDQNNRTLLSASWSFNRTHFFLELTGQTMGWMAFGISPTGQMDRSDILFTWCEDSNTSEHPSNRSSPISSPNCYAQDRFIEVHRVEQRVDLLSDPIQDWRLLFGRQNGTHTVIRAVRALVTSDSSRDYPITPQVNAIYAIGDIDPDITTGEVIKHSFHGGRSLTLLTAATNTDQHPPAPSSSNSHSPGSPAHKDGPTTTGRPQSWWNWRDDVAGPIDPHGGSNLATTSLHATVGSLASDHANSHPTGGVPHRPENGSPDLQHENGNGSLADRTTLLQLIVRTLHGLAGLLSFLNMSSPSVGDQSDSSQLSVLTAH
ncbi:hypothetical protein BV898_14170 [Hypsibius exemplaris]|uniref:DOMON domain-containing protein n=1 Tax=Hypsibius exemplaris TaxID=2072580 RepID=A0A1W0W8H8_HYPEX|nr:hypothetical protein BV898_14170 [Hypsibius exemplaris]